MQIENKNVFEIALKIGMVLDGEDGGDIVPALSLILATCIENMCKGDEEQIDATAKATFEMILKMIEVNMIFHQAEPVQ